MQDDPTGMGKILEKTVERGLLLWTITSLLKISCGILSKIFLPLACHNQINLFVGIY